MKISEVSKIEATRMAQLIKLINLGKWDLSSADVEEFVKIKEFLTAVATSMAADLQASGIYREKETQGARVNPPAAQSSETFKVRARGRLPVSKKSAPKKLSRPAKKK